MGLLQEGVVGVLHDVLHWQGEVLRNDAAVAAAADGGTVMNPEERVSMIRCTDASAAALLTLW